MEQVVYIIVPISGDKEVDLYEPNEVVIKLKKLSPLLSLKQNEGM